MKLSIAGVFLVAALTSPALATPKPTSVPVDLFRLTNAVMSSVDRGNPSGLTGIFTSDAIVIGEKRPYVWRGANAGAGWWQGLQDDLMQEKLDGVKVVGMPVQKIAFNGADAYMVQELTLTGVRDEKPFTQTGTMRYTFHRARGTWLISTMVWTSN